MSKNKVIKWWMEKMADNTYIMGRKIYPRSWEAKGKEKTGNYA